MQFVSNFVLFCFFHFYFDSFQTTRPGSHANAEHRILQGRRVSIFVERRFNRRRRAAN